jgi:PAS domain S-box-containing protein
MDTHFFRIRLFLATGPSMQIPQEPLNLKNLKDVLSLAVRGEPFDALIRSLLEAARRLTGADTPASLYMVDAAGPALEMAASAGLAPTFTTALQRLPIGPAEASCGRAAFIRDTVLVADVLEEPRLRPYLELARSHGIRACWSFPLHAPDRSVLGTLAFYHRDPCVPDAALSADIAYFADLAALLIERHLRERDNQRRHAQSQHELAMLAAESERRRRLYEAVLANTPDLVYVFDLQHRFTYANEVLLRMWSRSWDEAIGKNCLELGYPDWHAEMHGREIEQVKVTGQAIRGEVPFNGAFGPRIYEYIFTPVFGPDGEVEAIAGTTRDVTERKQFEEELLASQEHAMAAARHAEDEQRRLTAVLEAVPVGIVYVDTEGVPLRINAECKRLWKGAKRPEQPADYGAWRGWWADGSARDGLPIRHGEWAMVRALRGEDVGGDLVEIETGGSRRHLLLRATPVRDADGVIAGAVVAQLDISDQRRTEAALRESEQRFRTITNAMPQMVWTALPDGHIDYHNEQFYQFVGLAPGSAEGNRWAERVLHPDDRDAGRAAWARSVRLGQHYEMTYRLLHRSGEYRWILARALPLRDDAGQIVKWLGTDTDIHEKKLAEDALQAANQRKDEFLAMLAHELRNPLAPISAAAQVLRLAPGDPARVRGYADVIARQVGHMTALVNDLLDVSRVTRGMVQFECVPVDIKTVVTSAAEQVHPLVEARQHALVLELGSAPAAVQGDRARLIQVVANLLANAAKYTPPGGRIVLTLLALPAADGAGTVRIRVSDNGSGIEAALLPHVFELFTQGARTPDRAQGGLGLGLALARTIVHAHGGSIEADSAGAGCGSSFTVDLPLAAQRPADDPAAPEGALRAGQRPLRILLVDDNLDAASTLGSLLEAAGHRVTAMHHPAAALRDAGGIAPDALILDIGLPGMDGYTLARSLRQDPACAGALYIALTGYGQANDRALSRQAGFDHHLVKPVDAGQLLELLEHRARTA